MEEKGYREAIEKLYRVSPSFQVVGRNGYHPGMETMLGFDRLLGHPHTQFKTIHIAGTNGKGSVAHMSASLLASCGYRVGLYTSPHLLDFRERIKVLELVSGVPVCMMISENQVLDFLDRCGGFIEENHPSFFEITTAMAFDYFAASKVDYAVIEAGLGGRLDSTNIITPILSVITSIGFDHKDILGDTLPKIAFEKGGIIKKGVPVVVGEVPPEVREVFVGMAAEKSSPIFFAHDYSQAADPDKSDLKGDVQRLNLKTLSAVITELRKMKVIGPVDAAMEDAICNAARNTGLRGRWETLSEKPLVICDIGHNENALRPIMRQLDELYRKGGDDGVPFGRLVMIFGMAKDKDIESVKGLLPQYATYIFTKAQGSRAMPAAQLRDIVRSTYASGEYPTTGDYLTSSVGEALRLYMQQVRPDDLVYIGGSSYVVAEAMSPSVIARALPEAIQLQASWIASLRSQ